MYLKRLETYSDKQWDDLLFTIDEEHRPIVKQILTMPTKQNIESEFKFLKDIGIINGIGAAWMSKFSRSVITAMCPEVRYEFHDLEYLIGGTVEDRNRADIGLFKYSMISIAGNLEKIVGIKMNPVFLFGLLLITLIVSLVQMLFISIFWLILVFTGGKAFNYN